MATETDDLTEEIVKVASGMTVQVEVWHAALADAGIDGRVVGEDLTAGLGTALLGSVELWVRRSDAERAAEVLKALPGTQ